MVNACIITSAKEVIFLPLLVFLLLKNLWTNFDEIFGRVTYVTSTSWLDFGGDHDPGPEFLTEFSPLRGRDSCTKFVVLAAFVEVCSLHVYACI